MINLLITFDYELPLGSVSSYEKGLFEPSDKIIELGKNLEVPFIFFVDICSAMMFKKWDYEGYYRPFIKQIKKALINGHEIQLHVHPHWLTSTYQNGKFYPSKDFSLGSFTNISSHSIQKIINDAVKELNLICQEVYPLYYCNAFRAGGYSICQSSSVIIKSLMDNNILFDSSIIRGYRQKSNLFNIDFSNMPKKPFWFISPDASLHTETSNGLLELPISSMPVTLPYMIKRRLNKIKHKKVIRNHTYKNTGSGYNKIQKKHSIMSALNDMKNPVRLSFDGDHTSVFDLLEIVNYNVKKYHNFDNIILTTIGHPKSMGEYHMNRINNFIRVLQDKFGDKIQISTYNKLKFLLNEETD